MYCQGAHDSMSKAHSPRYTDAQPRIQVSGVKGILARGVSLNLL